LKNRISTKILVPNIDFSLLVSRQDSTASRKKSNLGRVLSRVTVVFQFSLLPRKKMTITPNDLLTETQLPCTLQLREKRETENSACCCQWLRGVMGLFCCVSQGYRRFKHRQSDPSVWSTLFRGSVRRMHSCCFVFAPGASSHRHTRTSSLFSRRFSASRAILPCPFVPRTIRSRNRCRIPTTDTRRATGFLTEGCLPARVPGSITRSLERHSADWYGGEMHTYGF
jgi:hypothetical protein